MLGANPLVDIGVLFILLGPLYFRWPVFLLPFIGAAVASQFSIEWANTLHQVTIPGIFITLFGYVIAVFAKAVGATE